MSTHTKKADSPKRRYRNRRIKNTNFAPPTGTVGEQWIRFMWVEESQFDPEAYQNIAKYLRGKQVEVGLYPQTTETNGPDRCIYARTSYDTKILNAIKQKVHRDGNGMSFDQMPENPFLKQGESSCFYLSLNKG